MSGPDRVMSGSDPSQIPVISWSYPTHIRVRSESDPSQIRIGSSQVRVRSELDPSQNRVRSESVGQIRAGARDAKAQREKPAHVIFFDPDLTRI